MGFLGNNHLIEDFKRKCRKVIPFAKTPIGKPLCIIAIVIFVLLLFAPLFHGGVGAALIGCVAAPYLILMWRKFKREYAVVPAVFFSLVMLLDMLIYLNLSIISTYLVAIVFLLYLSTAKEISFFDNIKDEMYMYISAGIITLVIVIIACVFSFLVSIAWWLLCLAAFLFILAVFFSVVLGASAYAATDDKRQARKKREEQNQRYSDSDDNINDYDNTAHNSTVHTRNNKDYVDVEYIDID